jgi:uncharacterized protein (TIGR02996 family)
MWSRRKMGKKIEVRLRDENTVIEGTLTETNDLYWRLDHPLFPTTLQWALQWRCPCGTQIDTATIPRGRFYSVTGGYFLQCPGCGRWYMHHLSAGYVEAERKERVIPDELLKRMPDEAGFLRSILAQPQDALLWGVYADYLEKREDARAEALRLKGALAAIAEGDPRRGDLLARLEQLRPALDAEWFALVVRLGPAALCLIGSPATDLADLPRRLPAAGVNVRPFGVVENGDYVVFCISCPDGPTPGTREALLRCAGHTVAPVAIVLTRAEVIDDDSLRDLVTLEEIELLSQVIPGQEVERLPLYYDFDPGLPRKLLTRIYEGPAMIPCSGG